MSEKEKKIGSAVLIGISCFAAVILLLMWMDLIQSIFTARYARQLVDRDMLPVISFMTSAAIALSILLFTTVTAIILCFFSKNKTLRIIALAIELTTVIVAIIFCALATKLIFIPDMDKISNEAFATISVFQTSILQIVGVVSILLTSTAIWYLSGFRKKGIQNDITPLSEVQKEAVL